MIRCTIELIPGGDERSERRRVVGVVEIGNDGSSTNPHVGNYNVRLDRSLVGKPGVWRTGHVDGFPRVRLGPYDLLYRALAETVGDRNP